MNYEKITISEFCSDINKKATYQVDLNAIIEADDASPIHISYWTDDIIAKEVFPEVIVMFSGRNYVNISQITRIERCFLDNNHRQYRITCGFLSPQKTILLTEI